MVTDDSQKKIVSFTVPQRVRPGESFALSGQLIHPKSGVGYINLNIHTRQNGGKWITLGEIATNMDGKFKSNLKAPTKKGEYKLRVSVPKDRLYLGGAFSTETITVDNPGHPNEKKTFLDTLFKWAPIIGIASVGIVMVGLSGYHAKDKQGGIEEKKN